MPLRISDKKKINNVMFRTGYFYSFKYKAFENDPKPNVICLNIISGIHENTGHEHQYMQAINLNYIPKKDRAKFIKDWKKYGYENKKLKFTWNIIKRKYPYIQFAIRRYLYNPSHLIVGAEFVPPELIEKKLLGFNASDYSYKVKEKIASRFKQLTGRKKSKRKNK